MEPHLIHPAWRSLVKHWAWLFVFVGVGLVCTQWFFEGRLSSLEQGALLGPLARVPGDLIVVSVPWVLALLTVLAMAYIWYSTQYQFHDERVVRHDGIIARNQLGLRYQDIRFVEANQSVADRLLRVGDVLLYSAGTAQPEVTLARVGDPIAVRDWLRERIDKA